MHIFYFDYAYIPTHSFTHTHVYLNMHMYTRTQPDIHATAGSDPEPSLGFARADALVSE